MLAASDEIAEEVKDENSWTENIELVVAMAAVVVIFVRSVLYRSCTYNKKTQPLRENKSYLKV